MSGFESAFAEVVEVWQQRSRLVRARELEAQISVLRAAQVGVLAGFAAVEAADAAADAAAAAGQWRAVEAALRGADDEVAVALTWTCYRAHTAVEEAAVLAVGRHPAAPS